MRTKTHKKRRLYNWHIWLGFNFAFLLLLVLLSGTIATISNEIDWLAKPQMRVSPAAHQVSWGEMERRVKQYIPPNHMLTSISQSEGDHFAYKAAVMQHNKVPYYVYVNQWTGEVTGTSSFLTVQRFFRDLHRHLFMPSLIGLPLVSFLAIILAISMYSGLLSTGRLRKDAFRLRVNKDKRVFLSDLHKLGGIWSLWFISLIVATSLWYFAEFGFASAKVKFEPTRPGPSSERLAQWGNQAPLINADILIDNAMKALPNWSPTAIMYPLSRQQAVTILGDTDDFLVRSRANRVFLDPVDGTVIHVQKSQQIGTIAYINEMADPLHFGTFANFSSKIIWFLFGLILTGLAVTGLLLTYRRLRKHYISRTQLLSIPILLLTIIAGIIYVERLHATEEGGETLTQLQHKYNELSIDTKLWLGQDSHDYLIKVMISHPHAHPQVSNVRVQDSQNNNHKLQQMTYANTNTFFKQLPQSALNVHQPLTLDILFANGEQLSYQLTSG